MIKIFERGTFHNYRITDSQLNEARRETMLFSEGGRISSKPTIFISHKHQDLEDLKDIIGLLQHYYNADIYIDSMDANMPQKTCGDTAERIKNIITKCDKFILLATDAAIESKWCNWELGFGDAHKFRDDIALFPMKEAGTFDSKYKGNEYMQIYPFIAYYDGTEHYRNGAPIKEGYYVCYEEEMSRRITPLKDWINKKK